MKKPSTMTGSTPSTGKPDPWAVIAAARAEAGFVADAVPAGAKTLAELAEEWGIPLATAEHQVKALMRRSVLCRGRKPLASADGRRLLTFHYWPV